jgi:hypothetical protein
MKLGLLNAASVFCLAWSCGIVPAQLPSPIIMGGPPDHYVLPAITGKPYTLTETSTAVRTQANGPPVTTVFVTHMMRDSEGRVRRELGKMEDGNFKRVSLSLVDPVGHFTASLFDGQKLAIVTRFPAPSPLTPEEKANADAKKASLDAARKSAPRNPNEEDLPVETISGISVPGKRLHLVMQGAAVTEDTWFDSELHIQMKSETEDPRTGHGHFSSIVSDLQRVEPAPLLFQIPDDYRVQSQN